MFQWLKRKPFGTNKYTEGYIVSAQLIVKQIISSPHAVLHQYNINESNFSYNTIISQYQVKFKRILFVALSRTYIFKTFIEKNCTYYEIVVQLFLICRFRSAVLQC